MLKRKIHWSENCVKHQYNRSQQWLSTPMKHCKWCSWVGVPKLLIYIYIIYIFVVICTVDMYILCILPMAIHHQFYVVILLLIWFHDLQHGICFHDTFARTFGLFSIRWCLYGLFLTDSLTPAVDHKGFSTSLSAYIFWCFTFFARSFGFDSISSCHKMSVSIRCSSTIWFP